MTNKPTVHSVDCPYCERPAVLVRIPATMGRAWRLIWRCDRCDAHVGCHKNTTEPLGTPAKRPLRKKREQTHQVFDQLWAGAPSEHKRRVARRRWYVKLWADLGQEVHIGAADEALCEYVIQWASRHLAMRENLETDFPIKRDRRRDAVQHG